MDDPAVNETPTIRPLTILAGGCLLILCTILVFTSAAFGFQQIVLRKMPTSIPSATPTSHLLIGEPGDQTKVLYESFSSNKNDWGLYFPSGKLETINGNLILQSNMENAPVIGISNKFNPSMPKYYLQADLSTDIDTSSPYGLVFGLNKSLNTYYYFKVSPRTEDIQLLEFNAGKWTELVPSTSVKLKPYPQANTLGVSVTEGSIKLYVNGELVTKYSNSDSFQSRDVGVCVSHSGYRLIVDNFFIYNKE